MSDQRRNLDLPSLNRRFEELCAAILRSDGYSVQRTGGANDRLQGDLLIQKPDEPDSVTVVEVKLYRSPFVERTVLRNAGAHVARIKGARRGMLIVSVPLDRSQRSLLLELDVDEIWDLWDLAKTTKSPSLGNDLRQLLSDADAGFMNYYLTSSNELLELLTPQPTSKPNRGEELVELLMMTSPGQDDAADFEDLCVRSIEYLFEEHLGELKCQHRIEDGFHRMDAIARVVPSNTASFWMALAQDFKCRYVVFEFKNYTQPISQNQIYSTEKYLYTHALRSVGIVIARNGVDENARRAAQGALRESGKVILLLDLEDLVELLRNKDQGGEPSDLLSDHLDKLLTTIGN